MEIDNSQIRGHAITGDDFHDTVRFLFARLVGDPLTRTVLIADHWEPNQDYLVGPEHGIRVPKQVAQTILDDLWGMGIRPSNYQDVVGTMQMHIDHMNRLLEWQHQQIVTLTEAALSKSK